jgi:uncharacterized membrane protein HdeD (DUF308 family)
VTVRRRGLRPASIRARIAVVSITISDVDGLDDLDLPRWWVPVAVGALAVLAGILALVWPDPTLLLVGICFGLYLIFAGIGGLVSAFAEASLSTFLRVVEAILGLITLLAGMILVVRPGASVVTAALVLGFWFLLAGCLQLARGIAVRESRAFNVGFGLLGIAAGTLVLAQPGIGVVTLVWIVGIAFIVRGVIAVALGLALRRLEHADRPAAGARDPMEPAT